MEGARGQQGAGGLGEQAAGEAAAGADGDGGMDLAAAAVGGRELVGDVEGPTAPLALSAMPVSSASWTSTSKPTLAAGEPAGDAGAAAGEQALAVEVVDVEGHGRPAGGGVRDR